MTHQRRRYVRSGGGPLGAAADYASAARALGTFYEKELPQGAAQRRIAALRKLSSWAGFEGVLQVEACPFHSPSLPRKNALLKTIGEGGLLGRYAESVRTFLRPRPVVVVSAVSTAVPLRARGTLPLWPAWMAEIAGLNPKRAEFIPLIKKNSKTTGAALVSLEDGVPKVLVLMMGTNSLPAEPGLRLLAAAVRRTSTNLAGRVLRPAAGASAHRRG